MSEIPFIVALLGGLVSWGFFLTGIARIMWLLTMSLIAGIVIAMEITGKVMFGKTISRLYWEWSVKHKSTHWLVMAIMLAGWLSLLWHLSAKVLYG